MNLEVCTAPAKANFNLSAWKELTTNYQNQKSRNDIILSLENGFKIRREGEFPSQRQRNLPTDTVGKLHITNWLIQGCQDNHFLGPFINPPFQTFHVSPVGTVPKDENKRRTIHHLSAPRKGISVNSEITEEDKTVTFIQFKQVVSWVQSLGKCAFIWKSDLENAYRQLPLHESAFPLLGIKWLDRYVFDTRGPFGLASMVAIFQEFADLLLCAVTHNHNDIFDVQQATSLHHLLDDFFGGHPIQEIAFKQFNTFFSVCETLGVKVSTKKSYEPSQELIILGYNYNTNLQTVSIPKPKIDKIKAKLIYLYSRQKVQARELLSIVGKLRWVSNIIILGSAFVRRLEEKAYSVSKLHFWVTINSETKKDIAWWIDVLNDQTLNQRPFYSILNAPKDAKFIISTDGSTTKGVGGFFHNTNQAFQALLSQLPEIITQQDIQFIELFALVLAASIWAPQLSGSSVTFLCDNLPVVFMVIKKRASFARKDLMQLIRILCKLANQHSFHFWIEHISTTDNKIADGLSRFTINSQITNEMKTENKDIILSHSNKILNEIFS